jgi:hypothetical protein
MVDIDVDLLVSFVLFRIVPEVRERWVKYSSADTIGIGYVIPLLFAGIEDLGEVRPSSYICLHVKYVVFPCGKCVELRCSLEISHEHLCAGIVSLFGECETDAWYCKRVSTIDDARVLALV